MLSKAVMLAVVFVLIASPATYKLTSGLLGRWIASSAGCPTQNGVVLHAAVFVAVLFALWAWRKACSARRSYHEAYTVGSKWQRTFFDKKDWKNPKRTHNLTAINQYAKFYNKTFQRMWDETARKWVWIMAGDKLKRIA
jgi:hypothetical protein